MRIELYAVDDLRLREGHPNKFRILETFPTIDGPRTRVTNHSFSSQEAAQKFIEESTSR